MMLAKLSCEPDRHADLERDHDRDHERDQGQRDVDPAAQRHKEDERDRRHRPDRGLEKRFDDGRRGLDDEDRRSRRLRRDRPHRVDETAQDGVVVAVSAWRDLDPDLAVGRDPGAFEQRRKRVDRHVLGGQEISHLPKRGHERRDQDPLRFVPLGRRRLGESVERARQAARLHRGRAVDTFGRA